MEGNSKVHSSSKSDSWKCYVLEMSDLRAAFILTLNSNTNY